LEHASDRLPDRFVLTGAGEEVLADVQAMEAAAESIRRRSAGFGDTTRGTVRLSAGEAMAAFIARHLPALRQGLQCVEIELVESHLLANLSRREADLLIREEVPDSASLVTRRLGRVAYAVYSSRATSPMGWEDDHTDVLPDVASDQFLLVHRDLRTLPRIRAIMAALVRLFHEQRFALEGLSRVRCVR
jgi:DNA-binding transcriptional LysR family regulator